MRGNRLLMNLGNMEFAMTQDGLRSYVEYAKTESSVHQQKTGDNTSSLITLYDDNGKLVRMQDENSTIPKGSVAVIDMVGPVMKYGSWWSYGADEIVRALRFAEDNENIVGSVFNVDGPGGSVNAIDAFIQFGKQKKKPVVSISDMSASLHYWAICAISDHKMAGNSISAQFGSVGVVCSLVDNRAYFEKLGYVFHDIYPEESVHKNASYKLALEGKYDEIINEELSPIARKFQSSVIGACPNLQKDVVGVLTGKMFQAERALELGMIDSIGSMNDAINRVHILSEIKPLY